MDEFPKIFEALRTLLKKHAKGMIIPIDTRANFTVLTRAIAPNKKPMWFAAIMLGKSAVSYHLMPLYFNPKLQAAIDPELLPRKQGKTCFNFKRLDPKLFKKLDALTRLAREHYEKYGFLKSGMLTQDQLNAALRAGGTDLATLSKLRKSKGKAAAKKRAATIEASGRSTAAIAKK